MITDKFNYLTRLNVAGILVFGFRSQVYVLKRRQASISSEYFCEVNVNSAPTIQVYIRTPLGYQFFKLIPTHYRWCFAEC